MTWIAAGENSIHHADNSAGRAPSGGVNRGPVNYLAPRCHSRFGVFRATTHRSRALSICSCPVHRNHHVKSSSMIMTAGNYKALRSRRNRCPVTVGINVPTCTSCMPSLEDERENGFVTRKSHPRLSTCKFREYLTSRGNYHGSPIIQSNRSHQIWLNNLRCWVTWKIKMSIIKINLVYPFQQTQI